MLRLIAFLFLLAIPNSYALNEKVRILAENDWFPYSAAKDDSIEGLSVDIVREAFAAVSVSVEFKQVPFARGMVLVKNGSEVAVINATDREWIREHYLVPRNKLILSKQVVLGRQGCKIIEKNTDFRGKKLGVVSGYIYPDGIINDKLIFKDPGPSDFLNFKKLELSRVDYIIIDSLVADHIHSQRSASAAKKIVHCGTLNSEKVFILFSKTKRGKKTMDQFDIGMDLIKTNGKYSEIVAKWKKKFPNIAPTSNKPLPNEN